MSGLFTFSSTPFPLWQLNLSLRCPFLPFPTLLRLPFYPNHTALLPFVRPVSPLIRSLTPHFPFLPSRRNSFASRSLLTLGCHLPHNASPSSSAMSISSAFSFEAAGFRGGKEEQRVEKMEKHAGLTSEGVDDGGMEEGHEVCWSERVSGSRDDELAICQFNV